MGRMNHSAARGETLVMKEEFAVPAAVDQARGLEFTARAFDFMALRNYLLVAKNVDVAEVLLLHCYSVKGYKS